MTPFVPEAGCSGVMLGVSVSSDALSSYCMAALASSLARLDVAGLRKRDVAVTQDSLNH